MSVAEFYLSPLGGIDPDAARRFFVHLTFQPADSSEIIVFFYSRRYLVFFGDTPSLGQRRSHCRQLSDELSKFPLRGVSPERGRGRARTLPSTEFPRAR
jgi:hypothetical protein